MLAFSTEPITTLLLPAMNGNGSTVNLLVSVRDRYDCVTEMNFASVIVDADVTPMDQFVDYALTESNTSVQNFFAGQLTSYNQNMRSQVAVILSQYFTLANSRAVNKAATQGRVCEHALFSCLLVLL